MSYQVLRSREQWGAPFGQDMAEHTSVSKQTKSVSKSTVKFARVERGHVTSPPALEALLSSPGEAQVGFWVSYTNIDPWEEGKVLHAVCADTQSPSVADGLPVFAMLFPAEQNTVKHAFLWHLFGAQEASFAHLCTHLMLTQSCNIIVRHICSLTLFSASFCIPGTTRASRTNRISWTKRPPCE